MDYMMRRDFEQPIITRTRGRSRQRLRTCGRPRLYPVKRTLSLCEADILSMLLGAAALRVLCHRVSGTACSASHLLERGPDDDGEVVISLQFLNQHGVHALAVRRRVSHSDSFHVEAFGEPDRSDGTMGTNRCFIQLAHLAVDAKLTRMLTVDPKDTSLVDGETDRAWRPCPRMYVKRKMFWSH